MDINIYQQISNAGLQGIFGTIMTGIVASILSVFLVEFIKRKKIECSLKKYIGRWRAYSIGSNSMPNEDVLQGEITISIEKDNVLDFKYKNKQEGKDGVDWIGKILINKDYLNTGRLIWQYINSSSYSDVGYKEILLRKHYDENLLYILPVNFGKQEYKIEVCKRYAFKS